MVSVVLVAEWCIIILYALSAVAWLVFQTIPDLNIMEHLVKVTGNIGNKEEFYISDETLDYLKNNIIKKESNVIESQKIDSIEISKSYDETYILYAKNKINKFESDNIILKDKLKKYHIKLMIERQKFFDVVNTIGDYTKIKFVDFTILNDVEIKKILNYRKVKNKWDVNRISLLTKIRNTKYIIFRNTTEIEKYSKFLAKINKLLTL